MRAAALFASLLATPAGAGDDIPWFDLALLPGPVGASLRHYRQVACGPVQRAGLPLPDDVRLVFLSCHGGPYACPGGADGGLEPLERQLGCPAAPTARQIATLHVVSRHRLPRLRAFYRETLGERFVELSARGGAQATFVESATAGGGFPWSPKRLHLAVSATRAPFSDAGYPSQIRVTLSVTPPSEPRPVVRCRDFDLFSSRAERERERRESRFCWW